MSCTIHVHVCMDLFKRSLYTLYDVRESVANAFIQYSLVPANNLVYRAHL